MYHYIFGPVPSRRLGMSLGIDLIPKKVCSLNCVYCEVGETTRLTTERKEYIPFEKLKYELQEFFRMNHPDPDYITFSGSGEPTLNTRIGDIIDLVKYEKPHIPVAVLTNGTLLYDRAVRNSLLKADVVLPSLDAATDEVFRAINRPHPSLTMGKYIEGLIEFRKEYAGRIHLEVFILPGYNDGESHILALKKAIPGIRPDRIQLNTLDRPGNVKNLRAATRTELVKIADMLDMTPVDIIAEAQKRKETVAYRKDAETAILETISRRPCTVDDLSEILGLHINEINKYLDVLESEKKIETVRQERGVFYQKRHP